MKNINSSYLNYNSSNHSRILHKRTERREQMNAGGRTEKQQHQRKHSEDNLRKSIFLISKSSWLPVGGLGGGGGTGDLRPPGRSG